MSQTNKNLKSQDNNYLEDNQDENKFVIFRLGQELYGTKLLEIREVVELLPTKPVPNTIESFLGVCNLRGQIIGVMDLRLRFSITSDSKNRPVLLVLDTDSGAIATAVDQVISVSVIPPEDIERNPNIVSTVPSNYIHGIGKLADRLITLVDLKSILSNDEILHLEKSKILQKTNNELKTA